jgi:hypothetical protein
MINRRVLLVITVLLSIVLVIATLSDSRSRRDEWRKEIWADQAGHYVYLPLVFNYSLDAQNFPVDAVEKTGHGFRFEEHKVITKYPVGVALLVAPFYIVAQTIAPALGYEANGFSTIYIKSLRIAAVFYLVVGLIFLFRYLSFFYKDTLIIIGLLFLLAGTNVIYYMMEPGMSHVYSFSLFAILLYVFKKWSDESDADLKFRYFLAICVVSSFIFNVRQLNLLFLPFVFLLNTPSLKDAKEKAVYFLRGKNLLFGMGIFIVLFLPQLAYNRYAHGTALMYSYQNESFTNWHNPKVTELLLSPVCGIFTYTPLHLVILGATIFMLVKRNMQGLLILTLFLTFTYIYASWHDWKLGCSFGCRAMVDITAILSLPLFYLLNSAKRIISMAGLVFMLTALSLFNLNLSSEHETCFFGKNDWDWAEYKCLISRGNIMQQFSGNSFNDFLFRTENVFLMTCEDGFVSADNSTFMESRHELSEASKLKFIYLDDHNVGIQLADGSMLSADASKENQLWANKRSLKTWEKFELIRLQGDTIALQAHNGKFVNVKSDESHMLIANASENSACTNFVKKQIE